MKTFAYFGNVCEIVSKEKEVFFVTKADKIIYFADTRDLLAIL